MSHDKDKNDELRDDRENQEERRQEFRDQTSQEADGELDSLGSQDERRKDGDNRH